MCAGPALNQDYWQVINSEKPLILTPGEHTIRFAWAGLYQQEESDRSIQILSNPVKIKIVPPATDIRKLTPAEAHRKRVADALHWFRDKEAVRSKNQEGGFDLRFFDEGYPLYTWQDIPILLELAQSNELLNKHIPSLSISSRIQNQCREGMVALWLVEGLHRRQKELAAEIPDSDTGKRNTRPYRLTLWCL